MTKAVRLHQRNADVLKLKDIPLEEPKDNKVRICVEAIALNRADIIFDAIARTLLNDLADAAATGATIFVYGALDSESPTPFIYSFKPYLIMTINPSSVRKFVAQYFEATRSNDARLWASCFAENAVVEDPVGTKPVNNSTEILEVGKAFMSGFETVGLNEEFVHVIGNEAAARWTGRGLTKEGKQVRFEGINIFKFDDGGQITDLKGYWSPDEITEEK